jgi:hypothetical protein
MESVPFADGRVDQLFRDLALEDRLGELVREERDRVEHLLALGLRGRTQAVGDFLGADLLAVVAVEVERLHRHEVDDALMVRLEPDGDLHHHRVVAQLLAQLLADAGRARARAIALVDEGDARTL